MARNRTQKTSQSKRPARQQNTSSRNTRISGAAGEIRIIGGDWRGRKLPVLDAEGLRPTSDRVRETLFNWLQFEVPGSRCLDLFAGSGALSFEALSRGAASCTLLELNANNARQLTTNLAALQSSKAQVQQVDSLNWLAQPSSQTYDIVFIDPPFYQNLTEPAIRQLFANGYVNDSSWLYLEQEKSLDWPELPQGWQCHREKTTSQVRFGLFCLK